MLLAFFVSSSIIHATKVKQPNFREFIHKNAGRISSVICTAVATATPLYIDNIVIRDIAGIFKFICPLGILLHPSSEIIIKDNLATPKQIFLLRLGKIASLLYCFKSIPNSCEDTSLSDCILKIIVMLGLARNTLGIPDDIHRALETI